MPSMVHLSRRVWECVAVVSVCAAIILVGAYGALALPQHSSALRTPPAVATAATAPSSVSVLPTGGGTGDIARDPFLTAVICPSDKLCLASTQGGRVVSSIAPANAAAPMRDDGTSTAWGVAANPGVLGRFACPAISVCLIGGSTRVGPTNSIGGAHQPFGRHRYPSLS